MIDKSEFNPSLVISIDKNPQDAIVGNWYYIGSTYEEIKERISAVFEGIEADGQSFILKCQTGHEARVRNIYPLFLNGEEKDIKEIDPDSIISVDDICDEEEYIGAYCYCLTGAYGKAQTVEIAKQAGVGIHQISGIDKKEKKFNIFNTIGITYICPAFSCPVGRTDKIISYIKKKNLTKTEKLELIKKIRGEILYEQREC